MQQRFAWPGIAHVERVARLHDGVLPEVLVDQHGDRLGPHVGRDVARLQVAEQRVNEHPVADFDRHLGEILVRAMHRVARLERGDLRPAELLELLARLRGRHVKRAVTRLETAVREHANRAGEIHFALLHHHRDPGVFRVSRLEDRLALVGLVDLVLLGELHDREDRAVVRVGESDLDADLERGRSLPVRRQRDRDRPERAVREPQFVARALPVGVRHESVEWREPADAEHDEVALLARGNQQLRQRLGALAFLGRALFIEKQRLQALAAMRGNETGHERVPCESAVTLARRAVRQPCENADAAIKAATSCRMALYPAAA